MCLFNLFGVSVLLHFLFEILFRILFRFWRLLNFHKRQSTIKSDQLWLIFEKMANFIISSWDYLFNYFNEPLTLLKRKKIFFFGNNSGGMVVLNSRIQKCRHLYNWVEMIDIYNKKAYNWFKRFNVMNDSSVQVRKSKLPIEKKK